jgi:catechol 2,3-dioxygenase-like lactoylglutathione lyase family enzyme
MALLGLASVTIGVPDVGATTGYYTEFGLTPQTDGWLSTTEGGKQLRLVPRARRQLVELVVRAEGRDDIAGVAAALSRQGARVELDPTGDMLVAIEPVAGIRAVVQVLPHPVPGEVPASDARLARNGARAEGVLRTAPVRPSRLGHAVLGTTDLHASKAFFVDGLGFKISDYLSDKGVFLRCSSDHHNVLVLAAPVNFLHHTSWQVADVDEIGRGATQMLEDHPERHVWGLGRHHAGSNFFWYLKDPAGNFTEYYADMDCHLDDQVWRPEVFEGKQGLYSWGPPPPPSFLHPDDLAELMIGSHATA